MLLVAPGHTARSKKLLVTKGIATSSKNATTCTPWADDWSMSELKSHGGVSARY